MSVLRFLHAITTRLFALLLMTLAFLTLGVGGIAEGQGGYAPDWFLPVAAVGGLYLLVPYWLPTRLRFPRRWADMVMLLPLAALCGLGAAMAADLPPLARAVGVMPGGAMALGGVAALLLAAVTAARIRGRQRWVAQMLVQMSNHEAEAEWADVEADVLDGDASEAETVPVAKPKGPRRDWLAALHLALIRLAGTAIFGATAYTAATLPQPLVAATIGAVAGFVAGLILLSDRITPDALARPTRGMHVPAFLLFAVLVSVLALTPHAMPLLGSMAAASAAEGTLLLPDPQRVAGLIQTQPAIVTTAITVFALAMALAFVTMLFRVLRFAISGPALPEVAAGDLPPIQVREPRARGLPAIGAAMKLYVIADWLVLRLLGLGLLGTGYILWQMMEAGRDYQAAQLSWGQLPLHALIGYAVAGTLFTLPFLMPRFIAQPSHVVGGMLKAMLLVGAGLTLLPALTLAITLFTPDIYHATLIATAPNLFKAVAGVAITSALLIAFFRQLGALPKLDYKGEAKIEMSAEDLRDLRIARMAAREAG